MIEVFLLDIYTTDMHYSHCLQWNLVREQPPPSKKKKNSEAAFHRQKQLLAVTQLSGGGQEVGAP